MIYHFYLWNNRTHDTILGEDIGQGIIKNKSASEPIQGTSIKWLPKNKE